MRNAVFQVFMVSDILAMCLSMMILFCLLWIMGNQKERVVILDLAIFLLELSFYATLLAFMTGLYVTTFAVAPWVGIFACAVCSLLILLMRKRVVTSAIRPIIKIAFVSRKFASSVKEFLYLLLCCVPRREMIRRSQQPNEIQKLKLKLHKHELLKTWRDSNRSCDECFKSSGFNWSFYCKKCDFNLHPQCAWEHHKKDDMLSWIPKRAMMCCSQQPKETRGGSSPTHGGARAEQGAPPSPTWRATACFDEKLKLELHEHELVQMWRSTYRCNVCEEYETKCHWSFCCEACNFIVHPKCALKNNEKAEIGEGSKVKTADEEGNAAAKDDEGKADAKEGCSCEGDV